MKLLETAHSINAYNTQLAEQIEHMRKAIHDEYRAHAIIDKSAYGLKRLYTTISEIVTQIIETSFFAKENLSFHLLFDCIDRNQFDADITVKFPPEILRTMGKTFTSTFLPELIEQLREYIENNSFLQTQIASIEQKGIYLNIKLNDYALFALSRQIVDLGDLYGKSNIHTDKVAIVEYSSPNVAKHLHAGHVRSTVIGHIIANLCRQVGYEVHTINHINDRGGFGKLIEGYERWHKHLEEKGLSGNNLNAELYLIFRAAEKAYNSPEENISDLGELFDTSSREAFQANYEQFIQQADERFARLASGEEAEFTIWKEIFRTSMLEFQRFYDKLGIHHDYTIGESFYEQIGREVLEQGRKQGVIVTFTQQLADDYYAQYLQQNPDLEEKQYAIVQDDLYRDIGSEVVLLDNLQRYVVLRGDGKSIYATRDLGALYFRCMTWDPQLIIYEVGQEQADHFAKLFESAEKLGWMRSTNQQRLLVHIPHGFYINAETKKKLSSRDGAANVQQLIDDTISYFLDKYTDNTDFSAEEITTIAQTLGVGSIIINDIGQKRADPVGIYPEINKAIEGFEQSGGAYMLYGVCRAKSLLRKASVTYTYDIAAETLSDLTTTDVELIKKMLLLPETISKAAERYEPAILVQYMYQLTQLFNSWYNSTQAVIEHAGYLYLSECYIQVMSNALRICNIEPLERI